MTRLIVWKPPHGAPVGIIHTRAILRMDKGLFMGIILGPNTALFNGPRLFGSPFSLTVAHRCFMFPDAGSGGRTYCSNVPKKAGHGLDSP